MSDRAPRVLALLVGVAVFGAAVLGAACSSGGSAASDPGDSTSISAGETVPPGDSTTTSTSVPRSTTTTSPVEKDPFVAALVLKVAPSGFAVQPDKLSDSGPTDLAKATRDEGSPGGIATLHMDKFVSGYQRVWATADGAHQNTIFHYRFATPAGAADYAKNRASELASIGSTGTITTFAVPATMPGAIGIHSESATLSFGAVLVSKGVFSIQAVSTDGVLEDQSAMATALAQAQYDRLP